MLFLISVGGVSANEENNTTVISDCADDTFQDDAMLADTLYFESPDNTSNILESNSNNDVLEEDVSGGYVVNDVVVNPSFESNTDGWDSSQVDIVSGGKAYAKNGTYFINLKDNISYISQTINFDTIDTVSFYYMSKIQGSSIDLFLDDNLVMDYTIKKAGYSKNRWEEVNLDVSGFTGWHEFKISQNNGSGFLDNFNVIYNRNLVANFTMGSFSVDGNEITINFTDHSLGLISNYLWDFGDGNTSTQQNPTHTFKLGHHRITLMVSNSYSSCVYFYDLPVSAPTVERTGVEYSTIQKAIDNAADGDVITVTPNVFVSSYYENLVIDKSLTLNFNNCTLIAKNNNAPIISVKNNAKVIINNISFGNSNLISADSSSQLMIENSLIKDSNITLVEGDILIRNTQFNNCYLTILNDNYGMDYCNVSVGGVIVTGGKSMVTNSSFSGCDVAINQTGGELSLISNSITHNGVGVSVSGGIANVNFNEIHSNSRFGLIYSMDNIDYSNNWWGSNNPSYNCSLIIPDYYLDVCQVNESSLGINSWIVLNITKHDLDYHYWIRGVTYYNLTIDLVHNNLGEDISQFSVLPSKFYEFKFNNVEFDIFIENGFKEYLFSWGYLTSDVGEMNVQFGKETVILSLDVHQTLRVGEFSEPGFENFPYEKWIVEDVPKVTYITPSTSFKDTLEVRMECNDSNAVIFYTLDGSDPGYSPTRLVYTGPFTVNETTVVHYAAIDSLGNFYMLEDCTLQGNTPTFTRSKTFVIFSWWYKSLTDYNYLPNYYTLDGTNPMDSDSTMIYTHPFFIDEISVLRIVIPDYSGRYNWPLRVSFYNYDFSVTYLKEANSSDSGAVWSQYQGDINNTGSTNYSGPLNNISKWTNENIISSGSAVVDNDNHIYIGGDDGYLYCLNSQGLVIWRFGTTSKIICTPTIGNDGNIYFTNWLNSTLYCLSPSGKLVWKYYLGDYNTGSSPVFGYNDILYVISGNDTYSTLFAFKNQKLLWTYKLPALIAHTPIIGSDGAIYLLSNDNFLLAVNVDGTFKFNVLIGVLSDDEAMNAHVSNPAYFSYGSGKYASLSLYDDLIYILNHDTVSAFYLNGTKAWHNRIFGVSGTPSCYDGVLYIAGTSGLYALNASNGEQLWFKSLKTTSLSLSSPLISNGSVVYVSGNSTVYAISLEGNMLWSYNIPFKYDGAFSLSSPTLTDDGTLIVTTIQGIYAFADIAAEFIYCHVNGTERTIQFTDLSTKGNNSYFWSFGDGYYSQEQNPKHVYAEPGKYRVELVVEHNGINLARNTTIEVISYDITPPIPVTAYINNTKTKGGIFNQTQIVTLVSSDESGKYTIYYTVDGSNPINSSTRRTYLEPISVEIYTVLNAVAVDESNNYAKVSTFTFNITDAINVNDKINTTLIQKIQELLDNAEPNSKFVFDYDELYGANFTINKPLNIISNVNTRLVGNNNQPVFTLTENAKNSTINGFIIENEGADGILISNTDSVKVLNSIVSASDACGINIVNSKNTLVKVTVVDNSTNGVKVTNSLNTNLERITVKNSDDNGVWILNSKNTILTDSLLESNGEDPYTSSANQILLDGSTNTRITNNIINYGVFGIHLKNTNDCTLIDNNTVYEGIGDAIYLTGRYLSLNITHNTLDGCFNGINFNGYSENVEVVNNLIQKMHQHDGEPESGREYDAFYGFRHRTDLYGQYHNAVQVFELASNFHGEVHLENNICILLEHRAWESRKTSTYTESSCDGYGYNLWDGSDSYHWRITAGTHYREGFVDLVLDRIGDSSYRLRLINQRTGEYLSDIPAFDVIFTAGRYTQTVKFINDSAIATFDVASSITTITAKISAEIKKSISWNIPISEGYSSSNRDKDPGYEAGEAINNPNPKAPSINDMINRFNGNNGNGNGQGSGNGNGDGDGNGNGNGQGSGNGHGSHGHGGSNVNGREGEIEGNANNLIQTDSGNSPSVGVEAAAEGDSDSVEGGSESGEGFEEPVNAYEVSKVINIEKSNVNFVAAVILFAVIVILGYGYRRIKKDGDEF
ncbi:PQQ-binding-like beta-propeller repeat protein [Methanobrevibacter sp.]|uniref:chitobiase/beta-hexosaminidase C-terminal domain-containing protein n=1 Tax=Methanobrevibacter sp. TaxID=66852 RepID=UPI0025CF04A9|nr:PQQ-binding-like beta-propeller repeat protein [Methanobrevibacter sp.]MBR4447675.1 chitobiase/beta-hexosaminidase C-terminal domain-containing protein [Methanobrevibacter sp.]